jgi:LysM repeat protein
MQQFINKAFGCFRCFFSSLGLFGAFSKTLFLYIRKHILGWFLFVEHNKNMLVKFFLMKRGRYNRPFLHVATMAVMGVGVLVAPFLADTYPIFSSNVSSLAVLSAQAHQQSLTAAENVFQTDISQKPRDKVITYRVEKGDTLSTIAKKFGVSEETIKWANDLNDDSLSVDDELKILPVTGIAHKVNKGDTIYTIAKKYDTEAQKIVDFPFNDFANPETFSLVEGQILVVPDGVKPEEQQTFKKPVFIAQGPVEVNGGGFSWPVHGVISQFASWYHMALDIAAPIGTPLVAAHNGVVTKASAGTWDGGYGTRGR